MTAIRRYGCLRRRAAAIALLLAVVLAACSSGQAEPTATTTSGQATPGTVTATADGAANGDDGSDRTGTGAPVSRRGAPGATSGTSSGGAFTDTFDGKPASPTPWAPANWDVTVHSRNPAHFDELETMEALHGPDCAGPPATHEMTGYDDAVFHCRDHMMTSIQDEWYGAIYLTPDHMVDFSAGEAVVSFDMSTARTSARDWPDLWITPFADNLQLPLEAFYPDLSGPPRNAVHITMARLNDSDTFRGHVVRNFDVADLPDGLKSYRDIPGFTTDAARRDRFELRISRTSVRFGMPAHNLWFVEATFAELGWTRGVVQLAHHSYNPNKECIDGTPHACGGGTWHWDNVTIAPAVPFRIDQVDARVATAASPTVALFAPAPAGSFARFAAIGVDVEISTDGGDTWTEAVTQAHAKDTAEEHFSQYWTPIPAGTSSITLRAKRWWGGDWRARDITVWSESLGK